MKTKYFGIILMFIVGASTWCAHAQVIDEDLKLLPSDGVAGARFGFSVAIANGIVAIGAESDHDNGENSGSAYLFDAVTGAQIAKLLPSDGAAFAYFGYSIAIDSGVVAVGALSDTSGDYLGSAYLFDAATGAQLFKLLPSDGAAADFFGTSIAIDNGIVAVAAYQNGFSNPGSAYLFDAGTGDQIARLLPSDGMESDHFGTSIAIGNGVVAVGDIFGGGGAGSAYLFDASTGAQLLKLLPSDGAAGDEFGTSVAIANGIVAVGAVGDDENGAFSGSAYLFDVATGAQLAKLLPNDGAESDYFGVTIAIADGVVALGAREDADNGLYAGSAYLFDASTGAQIAKLLPSDGATGDDFGDSIAIDNGVVAVGALGDDDNGDRSGSAYLFTAPNTPCPADLTGDGVLNFFDVSTFLIAFANQDLIADFNGDGVHNFFDISSFLGAYATGCP